MNITKRNHYNPCFWTALWNPAYFRKAVACTHRTVPPRQQVVHVLSVKSGEVRKSTVERVHYDKNLGVAEITREAALEFARRYHPDRYDEFLAQSANSTYPIFLDIEDFLSGIEKMPPYEVLMRVATTNQLSTADDMSNLAAFVVIQCLRSHAIMNSMIEWHAELGRPKFEHFVTLRWMLSDTSSLFALVLPLVCGKWRLYSAEADELPLCDSSVLVSEKGIMVALSPRLLLEIEPGQELIVGDIPAAEPIAPAKRAEYQRRAIGGTFREIIGTEEVLKEWAATSEFQSRMEFMRNIKGYNEQIFADGEREVWHLNAFGRYGE
jgi:hypothetical protein